MSYISYNNILAYVSNGDEQSLSVASYNRLYASNVAVNNSANIQRIKRIDGEEDYYNQTGPKSATVSTVIIPVTGTGLNQITDLLVLTGDFFSGSYFQVPNYRFEKCYLKSFSVNFEPWRVSQASLQFDCYGLATGNGVSLQTPSESSQSLVSPLRGTSINVSNFGYFSGLINEYESINFEVSVDRAANYEIGNEYPKKVSVAKISKTLQINGISNLEWVADYDPKQSMNFELTMADANVISVSGIVVNQSFSVDANGVAKTNLTIIEEVV